MSDPSWTTPPRPAWAEPKPPFEPPVVLTKAQRKRAREKANRRARREADPGVVDDAAELAARARVAARLDRLRPSATDQHRETVERHWRRRPGWNGIDE